MQAKEIDLNSFYSSFLFFRLYTLSTRCAAVTFFALINKNLPKSSIGIDQPFFWGDFSFILLFAVTGFPEFPGFPGFTGFSGYSCFPASLASFAFLRFLLLLLFLLFNFSCFSCFFCFSCFSHDSARAARARRIRKRDSSILSSLICPS